MDSRKSRQKRPIWRRPGIVRFAKTGWWRTRARTWDPLIKRHAARLDFSREFSQPSQNPIITDQWLIAKNPTARARHDWRTDASEASGVRVAGPLHRETHYFGGPVFLSASSLAGLARFNNLPKAAFCARSSYALNVSEQVPSPGSQPPILAIDRESYSSIGDVA